MSSISAGTTLGTALVSTGDTTGELLLKTNGTTTAVTIDTSQRMGVGVTPASNTKLDLGGALAGPVTAVAASSITCNSGNYFTKTISGTTTFTFDNVPSTRDYAFVLQLTNGGSATVNWPASVVWPAATAPTLTAAGVDLLIFSTSNGGTTWRGSSLVNYAS